MVAKTKIIFAVFISFLRCSKFVVHVKLHPRQPAFGCSALDGDELTAEESSEIQCDIAIRLISRFNTVLCRVGWLANVAGCESSHHSFAFDARKGVTETEIASFNRLAKLRLGPVGLPS
jgi:hypothetical protein